MPPRSRKSDPSAQSAKDAEQKKILFALVGLFGVLLLGGALWISIGSSDSSPSVEADTQAAGAGTQSAEIETSQATEERVDAPLEGNQDEHVAEAKSIEPGPVGDNSVEAADRPSGGSFGFGRLFKQTSHHSTQTHSTRTLSKISLRSVSYSLVKVPFGTVEEAAMLDVGINLFSFSPDTVLSASEEASIWASSTTGEQVVYMDKVPRAIRVVESYALPVMLRDELLAAGQFKSVSLRPGPTEAHDLVVDGEVRRSTGNSLILRLTVVDATGTEWFSHDYAVYPDTKAYANAPPDPYAPALEDFKNSLLNTAKAKGDEIKDIERMSNIKYAASLAPEVFGEYLSTSYDGRTLLLGMPSSDDALYAYAMRCLDEEKKIIAADFGRFYTESMGSVYQSYFAWRREYGASIEEYEQLIIELDQAKKARRIPYVPVVTLNDLVLPPSGREREELLKGYPKNRAPFLLTDSVRVSDDGAYYFSMDEGMEQNYPEIKARYDAAREKEAMANQQHSYMIGAFESHATAINVELFNATVELEGSVGKKFATLREKLVELYQREIGKIQTAAQYTTSKFLKL